MDARLDGRRSCRAVVRVRGERDVPVGVRAVVRVEEVRRRASAVRAHGAHVGDFDPDRGVVGRGCVPRTFPAVERLVDGPVDVDDEVAAESPLVVEHVEAPLRGAARVVVQDGLVDVLFEVFERPVRRGHSLGPVVLGLRAPPHPEPGPVHRRPRLVLGVRRSGVPAEAVALEEGLHLPGRARPEHRAGHHDDVVVARHRRSRRSAHGALPKAPSQTPTKPPGGKGGGGIRRACGIPPGESVDSVDSPAARVGIPAHRGVQRLPGGRGTRAAAGGRGAGTGGPPRRRPLI